MRDKEIKEDEIPLPNQNEKQQVYSHNSTEEERNEIDFNYEVQFERINYIQEQNLIDYKSKNVCQLVYSEEDFNEKSRYISYEKLIDILTIKEPYDKNSYKNFVWKNYDDDNELFFSSHFESGNLYYAIKHNSNEYDLILRPETGCLRTYQWFYFMIKINEKSSNFNKLRENPIIKLNIINLCKKSIILNNDTRILCYYNGQWSRDTHDVYYYMNDIPYLIDNNPTNNEINISNNNMNDLLNINLNSNNSNQNSNNNILNFHTLTFSFDLSKINTNPKSIFFSYCYPYTFTQLNKFIFSFKNNNNTLRLNEIGKTLDGNPINMLVITNFNDSFDVLANKKAIIFTGRVHPGESNSSYVIQGLIEFLLSNDQKASNLRKHYIFKIVPMLNPDGVIRGNFRMNSEGKDLNRMWTEENEEIAPSVCFCHQMIRKTLNSRDIYFFCDFHGHSNKYNFFLYSCKSKCDFIKIGVNNQVPNPNKKRLTFYELIFQEIYSKENVFFDKTSCVNKIFPSKIKTARAVLKNKYNIDFSYCLETSLGATRAANGRIVPFTIEQYKKVGRDFGISLYKFSIPKIYYLSYNSVRVNETKINVGNNANGKKNKGKFLVLPMINPNSGINNYNYNYNKFNTPTPFLSKGNHVKHNEPNKNKSGNNIIKKNYYKNKVIDRNKFLSPIISPSKDKNILSFKAK